MLSMSNYIKGKPDTAHSTILKTAQMKKSVALLNSPIQHRMPDQGVISDFEISKQKLTLV